MLKCEFNRPLDFVGTRMDLDGYEEYFSQRMAFSRGQIAGSAMKCVEKIKWHHKNPWHEKYFEILLGKNVVRIQNSEMVEKKVKEIPFADLISCTPSEQDPDSPP